LDKFAPKVSENTREVMAQYIHQCNARTPTGESAFHKMCAKFGYAKNPMVLRIGSINAKIDMTLIYGSRSWVDNSTGEVIKNIRTESFVDVKIMEGAGHHVYADNPELFNQIVLEACERSDKKA
jgi:pimeloyl-ACP methyl ester carboxylesterase